MIKLLKIDEMKNGVVRLQSQLLVGTDTADFIIENGILKNYGNGEKGFGFYKFNDAYKIVETKEEMRYQEL